MQTPWSGAAACRSAPRPDGSGPQLPVTPEAVAEQLPCGNDVEEFVTKIKPFQEAGFTEVALCQIGGENQADFIDWAAAELLPALRAS